MLQCVHTDDYNTIHGHIPGYRTGGKVNILIQYTDTGYIQNSVLCAIAITAAIELSHYITRLVTSLHIANGYSLALHRWRTRGDIYHQHPHPTTPYRHNLIRPACLSRYSRSYRVLNSFPFFVIAFGFTSHLGQ